MPTNKNAMTRYKILDELLSNRYHNYSLDDLTLEVNRRYRDIYPNSNGIVRRTIEKDIHYLEYELDVDIEHYYVANTNGRARKCLRYAEQNFSIFSKSLTDDEKYVLRELMSLVGQFEGLPNLDGLQRLKLSLGIKQADRQIISFTKNPLEASNVFGLLFTAISQKQVIEICYHTFTDNVKELKSIILYPYLLKEYNRRWYLFAASKDDSKLLNFSLDRIDEVVSLPALQYVDYDGDINERFEDIVGVTLFDNSPLQVIYFWVSKVSQDYVMTKPIHESQRTLRDSEVIELKSQYPHLKAGKFFKIECRKNYELIRELSSFGEELIVLAPSEIQTEIYNRICGMKEQYDLLRTKRA